MLMYWWGEKTEEEKKKGKKNGKKKKKKKRKKKERKKKVGQRQYKHIYIYKPADSGEKPPTTSITIVTPQVLTDWQAVGH